MSITAGGALVTRGEFSIVVAGLAVAARIEPRLGALATAYVLLLIVIGPLTARYGPVWSPAGSLPVAGSLPG